MTSESKAARRLTFSRWRARVVTNGQDAQVHFCNNLSCCPMQTLPGWMECHKSPSEWDCVLRAPCKQQQLHRFKRWAEMERTLLCLYKRIQALLHSWCLPFRGGAEHAIMQMRKRIYWFKVWISWYWFPCRRAKENSHRVCGRRIGVSDSAHCFHMRLYT